MLSTPGNVIVTVACLAYLVTVAVAAWNIHHPNDFDLWADEMRQR